MKEKIYLAGPWFTPEAMATQQRIEAICTEAGWPTLSPRLECVLKPDASQEDQRRVFFQNVHACKYARLVLANIEGLDTGTIWEIGAAYAYKTPLVLYSPNPGRKLNVMLAQGCDGFLAGWSAIESFLMRKCMKTEFNWEAIGPWNKEIF